MRQRKPPSVVSLEWKLPSRLRRPIRDELARQRQLRRQREAVVQFKRKPLYVMPETKAAPTPKRPGNIGAEHHTGDVYRASAPSVRLALPPYAGRFMRGVRGARVPTARSRVPSSPKPVPKPKAVVPPPAAQQRTARPVQRIGVSQSPNRRRSTPGMPLAVERDVPFSWKSLASTKPSTPPSVVEPAREQAAAPAAVVAWDQEQQEMAAIQQPKRRFALPLHFSIWPVASSKKKV